MENSSDSLSINVEKPQSLETGTNVHERRRTTDTKSKVESSSEAAQPYNGLMIDEEDEIFFGPMTDKEKLQSRKLRRKTEVYKPGFRCALEEDGIKLERNEASDITCEDSNTNQSQSQDESESNRSNLSVSCEREQNIPSTLTCTPEKEMSDQTSRSDHATGSSIIDVKSPVVSVVAISPQAEQNSFLVPGEVALFSATEGAEIQIPRTDDKELPEGTQVPQPSNHSNAEITSDRNCDMSVHENCKTSSPQFAEKSGVQDEQLSYPAEDTLCNVKMPHLHQEEGSVSELQPKELNEGEHNSVSHSNFHLHRVEPREVDCLHPKTDTPSRITPSRTPLFNPRNGCAQLGQCSVIYSSPLSFTTSVQAVQMQQPSFHGRSPFSITIANRDTNAQSPIVSDGRDGISSGKEAVLHRIDDSFAATQDTVHNRNSAFGRPNHVVDALLASQHKILEPQSASHQPDPTSLKHDSPAVITRPVPLLVTAIQSKNGVTAVLGKSPTISHDSKENMAPFKLHDSSGPFTPHQQSISSPMFLQAHLQQPVAVSPSVARQQLIEEKRALLSKLRAQKEQLKERIKQDNEKCFNMKLENASALRSNMTNDDIPRHVRLPALACDGLAALTLNDRELEIITKLHTIRNGHQDPVQDIPPDQEACSANTERTHLQWHQNLITDVNELSSPSRPRMAAKPILSQKKRDYSGRNNGSLHPLASSSSASIHYGTPRARQHLMF